MVTKCVTVCFMFLTAFARVESLTAAQKTRIKTFVDSLVACQGVPGLTLAVVSGNDTWTEGFGLADIDKRVKVDKTTLFGIGSVTKAFTTFLLSMLLEESKGRYSWTSKVKDILGPDFAFVDQIRTNELTLRDLATHRTGLHTAELALLSGYDKNITRDELFRRRFRFLPEEFAFRDVFDYNNWCYGLLGYIVEVLSKEPYEDVLRKRIFQPIGMSDLRILGQTVTPDDDNVAKPYLLVNNDLVRTDSDIYSLHPDEPAGGIAASAEDMSKWLHFLLRGGKTADNQTLISLKNLNEMFQMHQGYAVSAIKKPIYPAVDLIYGYGYGWFLGTYNGYDRIFHGGGLYSYQTSIGFYPALNSGIFTSVNGADGKSKVAQSMIVFYIADLLIGSEPWLNQSTACTFPLPWQKAPALRQNNADVTNAEVKCLECYTGTYGHRFFGDAEVKVGESGDTMELIYERIYGSLNATLNDAVFKLDFKEGFEFVSHPGNTTVLMPVVFRDKDGQKYNRMELSVGHKKLTFFRNVTFYYDLPKRTTAPTTTEKSQGIGFTPSLNFILFIFLLVNVFP